MRKAKDKNDEKVCEKCIEDYVFTQHRLLEMQSRTCVDMKIVLSRETCRKVSTHTQTKNSHSDGKTCTPCSRSHNKKDSWYLSSPEERNQNEKACESAA